MLDECRDCWVYTKYKTVKEEFVYMEYNPVTSNSTYLPKHLELILTCCLKVRGDVGFQEMNEKQELHGQNIVKVVKILRVFGMVE